MTKTLKEIMTDIEEVKKNVLGELATPIQQLVDMVNAKEIESFSLHTRKIQNIGQDPYTHIYVKVEMPEVAVLGLGQCSRDDLFMSPLSKKVPEVTKDKLFDLNDMLSGINKYLGNALPVDHKQISDHAYHYSLKRRDLKANWTPEDATKWPMLPTFLEGLVELHTQPAKKSKVKP